MSMPAAYATWTRLVASERRNRTTTKRHDPERA